MARCESRDQVNLMLGQYHRTPVKILESRHQTHATNNPIVDKTGSKTEADIEAVNDICFHKN
jgi:hypothetical protein